MYTKKRTVGQEVSYSGTGLHTGEKCTITFSPTGPEHGIKFLRTDIPGAEAIPEAAAQPPVDTKLAEAKLPDAAVTDDLDRLPIPEELHALLLGVRDLAP
mgnify:CR=1 FL=1